jgi:hypothetical protein
MAVNRACDICGSAADDARATVTATSPLQVPLYRQGGRMSDATTKPIQVSGISETRPVGAKVWKGEVGLDFYNAAIARGYLTAD